MPWENFTDREKIIPEREKGDNYQWAIYYTSPQSFIITFSRNGDLKG